MSTSSAIAGEPDPVDYDIVARFQITAQHRDVVAVIQTSGDSNGVKFISILDPHVG